MIDFFKFYFGLVGTWYKKLRIKTVSPTMKSVDEIVTFLRFKYSVLSQSVRDERTEKSKTIKIIKDKVRVESLSIFFLLVLH